MPIGIFIFACVFAVLTLVLAVRKSGPMLPRVLLSITAIGAALLAMLGLTPERSSAFAPLLGIVLLALTISFIVLWRARRAPNKAP